MIGKKQKSDFFFLFLKKTYYLSKYDVKHDIFCNRQSKAIVDFPFTNVPRKCSTTTSTRLVSPCNTHNDDERSIIIRWDLYENSFR